MLGGPANGLQFFAHVAIDGATEVMTVTLTEPNDRLIGVAVEAKVLARLQHRH